MNEANTIFSIPDRSLSGSPWETFSFAEWAERWALVSKPYHINITQILFSLLRQFRQGLGWWKGGLLFWKTLLWDLAFKKPAWQPEMFELENCARAAFYQEKFKENLPMIVFFNALASKIGAEKADKLIADVMMPVVLAMMASRYSPAEHIDSVEVWMKQARNYLGREMEKDKGFCGDVYLAQDRSEVRLCVTRCATLQILRAYGLGFTAAAFCMGDHISYHTLFPNLIFKRSHTLAIGDAFCDHEFRLRSKNDPIDDESVYGDCRRMEGMRELVRVWEERAKSLFFGSTEAWEAYRIRCTTKMDKTQ
jgi:hypothetical protein